jgi:mannitol-specific phosphotransferase system IIBC component
MIYDDLKLTGALTIALNDVIVQETENLVVTAGKNWVADRMNNANTVMTHMAVGTGTNAAAAGDTTLQTENDRNSLTSTTVTNNAIAYVATWAAGDATAALTEAGILDAASGGDLLARTVFSVVNKGAADSMTITWTITVS